MARYTQILYHVVFATKDRRKTLPKDKWVRLHSYMRGTLDGIDCKTYKVGGTEDHIHVLFSLHPNVTLAHAMKTLKLASSHWMKKEGNVPTFEFWQESYGAFTVSYDRKTAVMDYISNQEEHHKDVDFLDEFRELLERAGLEYDLRDLP